MWVSCFEKSNYQELYKEYEQLVDAFTWPLSEIRKLSYRERKHWVNRYLSKLKQMDDQVHQMNNSNQTISRSVGQGVTFSGIPYR